MKGKSIVRFKDKTIIAGNVEIKGSYLHISNGQKYNYGVGVFENRINPLLIFNLDTVVSIENLEYWKT